MSTVEKLMNMNCLERGLISKIYKSLVDGCTDMGWLGAWREDLQEDISIEKWEEACTKAQSRTTNTRLKLLQYNWLMRTYITPEKLNRYNSTIPYICVKRKRYTFPLYLAMYGNTKILAGSETMHSKHFTDSSTLSPTAVYTRFVSR